eukprot:3879819-Pyramimonas_sp.AAC.2
MHIVQAVRELYEVVEGGDWSAESQLTRHLTRLVIIGRRLDRDALASSFAAKCCIDVDPPSAEDAQAAPAGHECQHSHEGHSHDGEGCGEGHQH